VPEITSAKLFLNGSRENIKRGSYEIAQDAYLTKLCRIEDDMVLTKYEHKGILMKEKRSRNHYSAEDIVLSACTGVADWNMCFYNGEEEQKI